MTFGYQGDPFDIFDEQAYDFQQRQPGEFEVEGSDHASVPGSSDRVREHGQGKLEYRCDDGSWSTYSGSTRLDMEEGRTDKFTSIGLLSRQPPRPFIK